MQLKLLEAGRQLRHQARQPRVADLLAAADVQMKPLEAGRQLCPQGRQRRVTDPLAVREVELQHCNVRGEPMGQVEQVLVAHVQPLEVEAHRAGRQVTAEHVGEIKILDPPLWQGQLPTRSCEEAPQRRVERLVLLMLAAIRGVLQRLARDHVQDVPLVRWLGSHSVLEPWPQTFRQHPVRKGGLAVPSKTSRPGDVLHCLLWLRQAVHQHIDARASGVGGGDVQEHGGRDGARAWLRQRDVLLEHTPNAREGGRVAVQDEQDPLRQLQGLEEARLARVCSELLGQRVLPIGVCAHPVRPIRLERHAAQLLVGCDAADEVANGLPPPMAAEPPRPLLPGGQELHKRTVVVVRGRHDEPRVGVVQVAPGHAHLGPTPCVTPRGTAPLDGVLDAAQLREGDASQLRLRDERLQRELSPQACDERVELVGRHAQVLRHPSLRVRSLVLRLARLECNEELRVLLRRQLRESLRKVLRGGLVKGLLHGRCTSPHGCEWRGWDNCGRGGAAHERLPTARGPGSAACPKAGGKRIVKRMYLGSNSSQNGPKAVGWFNMCYAMFACAPVCCDTHKC